MYATIAEVTVAYLGETVAQLPAAAHLIDATEFGSNQGVGAAMQCTLLYEVVNGGPPVTRTFRAFRQGDTIDLDVWVSLDRGWFQRTGTGLTTQYAIYEKR